MWVLSLLTTLVVLALLGLGINYVEDLERQNRAVEAQLRATQMYDAALDARMKEIYRFRHDVNGLLQAIEFASAGDHPHEEEGVKLVQGTHGGQRSLLDALLDLKRAQCAENGISFSWKVDEDWRTCIREREVSEEDVNALVQNLLQNAYEASLGVCPASERLVNFQMLQHDGKLVIEVVNRTSSDEAPSFETTKTHPELHGIGLQVVEDIVQSYDGIKFVDFDPSTRLLTIRVTL